MLLKININMLVFEKGHESFQNFWIFKIEISCFERVPIEISKIFQLNLEKHTMHDVLLPENLRQKQ